MEFITCPVWGQQSQRIQKLHLSTSGWSYLIFCWGLKVLVIKTQTFNTFLTLNLFIHLLTYLLTYLYIIKWNKIRIVLLSVGCWLEKRRDHMFCVWSQSPDLHVASAKHIPGILQEMTVTAQCEVFSVNVSITSGLSSHHAAVWGNTYHVSCDMWLYTHSAVTCCL